MLRQLLADRIRLKVRIEPREVDVYALVVDRADRRRRTETALEVGDRR